MKVPDSALNLALPPSPNARIPGLVWLLGVFFLGLMTVVTCHVAVAADYAYRFEDIQSVNEGEQATFTFEITQASVDGVPAANNEVQTGDFLELRFAIVDGSAVIDSDFSFDTGGDGYSEFVLFPGFRKVNITIKTADDQTVEPTETFALQFDVSGNFGTLNYTGIGAPYSATATILDDDVIVTYTTDGNGTVNNQTTLVQHLNIGDSTETVAPVPGTSPLRYSFKHWHVSDGDKSITVPFEGMIIGDVRINLTITAIFVPIQHTVTYQADPGGSLEDNQNTITQTIDDTADCQAVTATPAPGYRFTGWEVLGGAENAVIGNPDTAALTITAVSGPVSVKARFTQIEYTLAIDVFSPIGPAFSESRVSVSPQQDTYYYGDVVHLTAIAGTGTRFSEWTGALAADLISDVTSPGVSMTMTADVFLSADFIKQMVTLTMQTAGSGAGSTLPAAAAIGIVHTFEWGASAALAATAEITSDFAGWSPNVENGAIVMIGNQTVVATFEIKLLTVTLTAGPHGMLRDMQSESSASFTFYIPYGQNSEPIDAIPDIHYQFAGWQGANNGETSDRLILRDVTTDMSVTAEFVIREYTVSFHASGFGSICDHNDQLHETEYYQVVSHGDNALTVTAVPAEEMLFEGWYLNGEWYADSETIVVSNVTDDMQLTFNTRADILGCALPVNCPYVSGFNADDFELFDVAVDENGHLVLQTGLRAIDPNQIVIPFEQDVYVTFLHEGAGFKKTDFGWIDPRRVTDAALLHRDDSYFKSLKNQIYEDINDNDKDGVLDGQTDHNEDGRIDRHDNKIWIGKLKGGAEIVFYLDSRDNSPNSNCSWCGGLFFTKRAWNENHGRCPDTDGISRLIRLYESANEGDTTCYAYVPGCGEGVQTQGWLDDAARTRLRDDFGFNFRAPAANEPADFNSECVDEQNTTAATHAIIGAPDETPFAWVLGIDDTTMDDADESNDYDYNDVVFLIERKNGGMAQLASPVATAEAHAFYTAVEFEVYDHHPGGACAGKTELSYSLIIDGEPLEITEWDEVFNYHLAEDGTKIIGSKIFPASDWTPGNPADTFRKARIDLAGLNRTGHRLQWQVDMTSEHEACIPKVVGATLNGETASHDSFSRATPVVLANVLYSGFYQTPAQTWTEKVYRGRLAANLVYDPRDPEQTATGDVKLWDAGEVLAATDPDQRRILFPDIELHQVGTEYLKDSDGNVLRGDNQTRSFSGRLQHYPVCATTVVIAIGSEYFTDLHTDQLKGSINGYGTINRFTGQWAVTFTDPPLPDEPIRARYNYYRAKNTLKQFRPANVTKEMLALTDETIWPDGFTFDLNHDDRLNEADADWLVEWVRGYRQPNTGQIKTWLLGPIDHSVPAVLSPPGKPEWLFIGQVDAAELSSYETFRTTHAERPTVAFVGSRDGMLHAFDAGKFRHGDNEATTDIDENRGYFLWEPKTDVSPGYCESFGESCPNYGTGQEIWAFIPADLMPRLKNNSLRRADQAYVDASPALADVYIDTDKDGQADAWRTILLAAQGNGGDTVFCLDVTDPYAPTFLWEFASPELFRSRSSPAVSRIGRIRDPLTDETKWVAFFVSGKMANASRNNFPAIYMIDVANGNVLQRIVLDTQVDLDDDNIITAAEQNYGRGGLLSGQPAIVDSDYNGFIDRLYVGSDRGLLYKVNLPDDPQEGVTDISCTVMNTVFTADRSEDVTDTVSQDQRWHPIYGSPTVIRGFDVDDSGQITYNIKVFFGTGDSPYYDENIDTANTTYHFFAYVDKAAKQEIDPTKISLDWFVALPPGNRVFASAFAAAETIYFGTSTAETEDPCEGHGQVDGNQGRMYAYNFKGVERLNRIVGDIRTAPMVEDEHLYFRTPVGLHSLGGGLYNTPIQTIALPKISIRSWQEID